MGAFSQWGSRSDAPSSVTINNGGSDRGGAIVKGDSGTGFAGAADWWLGIACRARRSGKDWAVRCGRINGKH